ncbi:Hypothetical protein GLP15_3341 [Giardia lamblia P15]|uniref:Uncharacterized protein n=1 Tax=Giardia intestinalis (strain P15) TaxID=658858 RepID=E1EVT9_GIAIA|nr:Hypothetical protein GLP15_3341 [Giardia lamblia P15]
MVLWLLLFTLITSAYLPSRMLVLYDGPEAASKDLQLILTGARIASRSMRMDDPKFKLPKLVLDGVPQYSHIAIIGRGNHLTAENYGEILKYVEGTLDPYSSKLTEDERMILPTSNNDRWTTLMKYPTEYIYKDVFEPLPGASIAIFTDAHACQRLLNLLKNLGMKTIRSTSSEMGVLKLSTTLKEKLSRGEQSGCDIIGDVNYKPLKQPLSDILSFTPSFLSDVQRAHEIFIFESTSREMTAGLVWQGLENNARVVAIGFLGALADTTMMMSNVSSEQYFKEWNAREGTNRSMYEYSTLPEGSIQAFYQLSRWFGFAKCMLRVSILDARPVQDPSGCDNTVPAQHGEARGNTVVVEGNLVHYIVKIEELINNTLWRPYVPKKITVRLDELVMNNARRHPEDYGLFPSETRQIKKQISALSRGLYSRCLQSARKDLINQTQNITMTDTFSSIYTDIQLHESIMGPLISMNLALLDEKKGLFDLVIVPDLVRSYHMRLDYNVPGYNRIKLIHHLHVNMDRTDAFYKHYADWPLFVGLGCVLLLAMYAGILLLTHKETHKEEKEE